MTNVGLKQNHEVHVTSPGVVGMDLKSFPVDTFGVKNFLLGPLLSAAMHYIPAPHSKYLQQA